MVTVVEDHHGYGYVVMVTVVIYWLLCQKVCYIIMVTMDVVLCCHGYSGN